MDVFVDDTFLQIKGHTERMESSVQRREHAFLEKGKKQNRAGALTLAMFNRDR